MATGAKGRVLLVEASRGAEARAKRLAKAGFQTRRVADESAALALGAKEAFDVLLVDLELPRIDGLSLIRRLRANGSAAAVVLLAAELTNELAAKAVEAGVFQVLKKPAQANDLERVVAAGVTHTRHVLATLRAVLRPSGAVRSVPATDAKNEFGSLLETAVVDGAVVITKHDAPKAVLLSVDRVNALLAKHEPDLLALTREFDDLVARMRTREARAAARSLFSASPEQLGEAALAGARKGRG
jgi:antitoxin Phd